MLISDWYKKLADPQHGTTKLLCNMYNRSWLQLASRMTALSNEKFLISWTFTEHQSICKLCKTIDFVGKSSHLHAIRELVPQMSKLLIWERRYICLQKPHVGFKTWSSRVPSTSDPRHPITSWSVVMLGTSSPCLFPAVTLRARGAAQYRHSQNIVGGCTIDHEVEPFFHRPVNSTKSNCSSKHCWACHYNNVINTQASTFAELRASIVACFEQSEASSAERRELYTECFNFGIDVSCRSTQQFLRNSGLLMLAHPANNPSPTNGGVNLVMRRIFFECMAPRQV